jgi:hypothetical protein
VRAQAVEAKVLSREFQSSCEVRQSRICGRSSLEMVAISILIISWSWRNHCSVTGSVKMVREPSTEVEVCGWGGVLVPSPNPYKS